MNLIIKEVGNKYLCCFKKKKLKKTPQKKKPNSKTLQEKLTFVSKRSSFTPGIEMLYLYRSLKFTSQQSISRMKQKAPWK